MKKRLLILAALAVPLVALLMPASWRHHLLLNLQTIIADLRNLGALGIVATGGLQTLIAASGIVPASLLGMTAGAAYGMALGFAISAAGTMVGAVAAFWLSRSVFRPAIVRFLAEKGGWQNFDDAIARDGWRFVCLIRLSPLMPFAITSYSLGLSSISLKDYLIGTCASLPALGLYIFLGTLAHASLDTLSARSNPWALGLLAMGGLATVLLALRIGQLAMKASAKSLAGKT